MRTKSNTKIKNDVFSDRADWEIIGKSVKQQLLFTQNAISDFLMDFALNTKT